jgi:two-component system chemotaxis response regulator CheB
MVVDDSAVVRQVLTDILTRQGGCAVTTAPDPIIALDKIQRARPDVVLLDLEMPRMDGLSFLRKVMDEDPIPVVVCSGLAERGTRAALKAIEAGAVDVVAKPKLGVSGFLYDSATLLVEAVRGAAGARVRRRQANQSTSESVAVPARRPGHAPGRPAEHVVAIGASTGGPEALRLMLQAMPEDAPAILIVQHMPEVFTRSFAEGLDRTCRIQVKEAADGDAVLEGRALIAPGSLHMSLVRCGGRLIVRTSDGPLVSRHRPSVDVLFRSVAQVAGANAVGVILTGMGSDGSDGLLEMRRAGALTLAQDEATSVVFGMPKEAIARGAADAGLPLDRLAAAVLHRKPLRPTV